MNDLASEFFYTGIAHIPPGLLIIVLYWRTEVENVFHTQKEFFSSPLLFITCVVGIAWLVGLMVEAIIYAPIAFVLQLLSPHCEFAFRWHEALVLKKQKAAAERGNGQVEDKKLAREKRRQAFFLLATKIMVRDLSVIFLFAWVASVFGWFHAAAWFPTPEPFSNLSWKGCYSFLGFFGFMLLWFMQMGFLTKKGDQQKKAPTSREIGA
jgi:hypothetical protein